MRVDRADKKDSYHGMPSGIPQTALNDFGFSRRVLVKLNRTAQFERNACNLC
jgi:hypothetical protein